MRIGSLPIVLFSIFITSSAHPQSLRGKLVLAQNETIHVYRDGTWTEWFHPDPTMALCQVGQQEFIYVQTDGQNPEGEFTYFDVDIGTGKLTPPPRGMSRLRTLTNGNVIYSQESGPAETVIEYKGTTPLRVIQKHTPGFKNFQFLPNGSYLYLFRPEEIDREGPTQLYFNNGQGSRLLISNNGPILYPRFINNGKTILWLREVSEQEMNEDPYGGEIPLEEDPEMLKIGIESLDLISGRTIHIGDFQVSTRWPDIAGQFVSWENSSNVAFASAENQVTIVDATNGTVRKNIRLSGAWELVQPMIRSFGGTDQGYSLGSHLILAKIDKRKYQFLDNVNFKQQLEVPMNSTDASSRASYLSD